MFRRLRRRITYRLTRPHTPDVEPPINWPRVVNWLMDMEEGLSEGQYLHVCDLVKQLHSTRTVEEKRRLLHELEKSEHESWTTNGNALAC